MLAQATSRVAAELGGYFLISGKAFPATEPIQAMDRRARADSAGESGPDDAPDALCTDIRSAS